MVASITLITALLLAVTGLLNAVVLVWSVFHNGRGIDATHSIVNSQSDERARAGYAAGVKDQSEGKAIVPEPGVPH